MTLANPRQAMLGWLSMIDRLLGTDGTPSDRTRGRAEAPYSRGGSQDGLAFCQEEQHWRDDEERERELQILLSFWM
jgi:hypothetical protein